MVVIRSPFTAVLLVLAAAVALLTIPAYFNLAAVAALPKRLIQYQLHAWVVALFVLAFTLVAHRAPAVASLRLNRFAGEMAPVRWLLIKPGENWSRQGWQFAIMLTLVTALVVSQQLAVDTFSFGRLLAVLPTVVALALSNSLVEELIFRHSIVSAFDSHALRRFAPLISGGIFGCAHYFGSPGGVIGVLMAGFLGWLLAKSMQETGGIFWAWTIHACLDVVIFGCMLLVGHT